MRETTRARATLIIALVMCLACVAAGSTDVVVDDFDALVAQDAIISRDDGHEDWCPAVVAQPQPAGDDYDARLYRADLARAKRWGS